MKKLTYLICGWMTLGAVCAARADVDELDPLVPESVTADPVTVTPENFGRCRQMQPSAIYRFLEDFDFQAAPGESAMTLAYGEAGIYVPAGVKVTLRGGAANGMTGAGAGIEVAPGAKLYVYGEGELEGIGGGGAPGASGANGTSGSAWDDGDGVHLTGGGGGAGGYGGGGAGAGLGGRGGRGGAGAPDTPSVYVFDNSIGAWNGLPGENGEDGGACGEVVLYGSKSFRGGVSGGEPSSGGAAGVVSCVKSGLYYYSAFGGGGGGAGGEGGAAPSIGWGGYGGGGGGAGGGGACRYKYFRVKMLSADGWGRGGGGFLPGDDNRGYKDPNGWVWDAEGAADDDTYPHGEGGACGIKGQSPWSVSPLAPAHNGTVNGENIWKGDGRGWFYDPMRNVVVLTENGPYDVQGDVKIDGNGHYRVTFPGSPVVLWLKNGEYILNFKVVVGYSVKERLFLAIVNGNDTVAQESQPVGNLSVKVNDVNVGALIGAGWTYSPITHRLVLDGSVPYEISGSDTLGNVKVCVSTNATVTLKNLELVDTKPDGECIRVSDGADLKLLLSGENVLQAAATNGTCIRVFGKSKVEIDSADEDGLATLIAQGGRGAPAISVEAGSSLTVSGGVIVPAGGGAGVPAIAGGEIIIKGGTIVLHDSGESPNVTGDVTLDGGSVPAAGGQTFGSAPKNALGQVLQRVTVDVEEFQDSKVSEFQGLKVEGLRDYGTKDIVAVDGKVGLWLPDAAYEFSVDDVPHVAQVAGAEAEAFSVTEVDYLDWDGSAFTTKKVIAHPLSSRTTVLDSRIWYAVTGEVATVDLKVNGTANLILCDGAKLTANGAEDCAGIEVTPGNALTVYGQANGTGELIAQGGFHAAGIGGGESVSCGKVTINGGIVTASGGGYAAGVGGGFNGNGGAVTINGGRVKTAGGAYGAGIGGGWAGVGGTVTINGGTVYASHAYTASDIGGGGTGNNTLATGATVMINGGSIKAGTIQNAPTNGAGAVLYCVMADVGELTAGKLSVEGLDGYGMNDVYPLDGKVYLWLPDGTHRFVLTDGERSCRYFAKVNGKGASIAPVGAEGLFVNGADVGQVSSGEGWSILDNTLLLGAGGTFVISGDSSAGNMPVRVGNEATLILSNAVLYTTGCAALDLTAASRATILAAGATSYLASTNAVDGASVPAVVLGDKTELTLAVDSSADPLETLVVACNYGDSPAVVGKGKVIVIDGSFAAWADVRGLEGPLAYDPVREIMSAGADVYNTHYTEKYDGQPSVIVGPVRTLTIRDIPHVTGVTVLDSVNDELPGADDKEGVTTYRLMVGDIVKVHFNVEPGYTIQIPNPIVYESFSADTLLDASNVPILRNIDYVAWDEATASPVDCVCSNYTPVTDGMTVLESGWYVVAGAVTTTDLKVNGEAHLILCDYATLSATGSDKQAGITVTPGNALTIYGQANNIGALSVLAGAHGAGIGGGEGVASGAVTINGGIVLAVGHNGGADIGGGNMGAGGTVKVNGGTVLGYYQDDQLPEGYRRVKYIESTAGGNQYINTGYTPTRDTKVVCRLLDKGTDTSSSWGAVFGSRTGGSPEKAMFLWLWKENQHVPFYARAGVEAGKGSASFPFGDVTTVTCQNSSCDWINDAGTKKDGIMLEDKGQEVGFAPLTIFALNAPNVQGGVTPVDFWSFRLYSFQIYEGAELERDFVPCVSASGEAGLYDTVYGKFYGNEGQGQFAVGGAAGGFGGAVTVNGGSVKGEMIENAPVNGAGAAVYCVTVNVEKVTVERLKIEGLEGYGTSGVSPIDGKVYLWLPDGFHAFTVDDVPYAVSVRGGATTAARAISVDYREWNGNGTVEKTALALPLVGDMTVIGYDCWYVVTGDVSTTDLRVDGVAHLILADDVRLTAMGSEGRPGLAVTGGNQLFIYGQTDGTGELVATGGRNAAGLGSGPREACGSVTINGGTVVAWGGWDGAGIGDGSGLEGNWQIEDGSLKISINGGRVRAFGDGCAAGIGGGWKRYGGSLQIKGGTIEAVAGKNGGSSLGSEPHMTNRMSVEIMGGSIMADKVNSEHAFYCVTVDGLAQTVVLGGLDGYGKNDIVPVNGKVYLWLPNGDHTFTVDGEPYAVTVEDGPATAIPVLTADYLAWNGTGLSQQTAHVHPLAAGRTEIGTGWYAVTGTVNATFLRVSGDANLVICNGASLNMAGGIELPSGSSLNIYGQLTDAANPTTTAGRISASGVMGDGALTVRTVVASLGQIATSVKIGADCNFRATGADNPFAKAPVNDAGQVVRCVQMSGLSANAVCSCTELNVTGSSTLSTDGDGNIYIWRPAGEHRFVINRDADESHYRATSGEGAVTVATKVTDYGLTVNGHDIGQGAFANCGWLYKNGELTLTGALSEYVLSGSNDWDVRLTIVLANKSKASLAGLRLSGVNAGVPCIRVADGASATLNLAAIANELVGGTGASAIVLAAGTSLRITAAEKNATLVIRGGAGAAGILDSEGAKLEITGGALDIAGGANALDIAGAEALTCGTVSISGGVFAKPVATRWLAERHVVVANTYPPTAEAYPFAVVPLRTVTIGVPEGVPEGITAYWSSGGLATELSGNSFDVPNGTSGVKVFFEAKAGYTLLGSQSYTFKDPITADMEIPYADLPGATAIEYTIAYVDAAGNAFTDWAKGGYNPPKTYTVVNPQLLPARGDVDLEKYPLFCGWADGGTVRTDTTGCFRDLQLVVQELPGSLVWVDKSSFASHRTLVDGETLVFESDVTYEAGEGESALRLASGTAYVVVPTNVTVNLFGGAAHGMTGAGAGIEVAAGAKLVICGAGRLTATGGNAANGESGGAGLRGIAEDYNTDITTGTGGRGGNGGGGAGAGIGGRGGNGGMGGDGGPSKSGYYRDCLAGNDGRSGKDANAGGACGTIEIRGSVKVTATGGVGGANGEGGAYGDWVPVRIYSYYAAAFGSGGGGGGGGGFPAANVGTGGGGGGGGGGGASGGISFDYFMSRLIAYRKNGYGGMGGLGSGGYAANGGERPWSYLYEGVYYSVESVDDGYGRGGAGGYGGNGGSEGREASVAVATAAELNGMAGLDGALDGRLKINEKDPWIVVGDYWTYVPAQDTVLVEDPYNCEIWSNVPDPVRQIVSSPALPRRQVADYYVWKLEPPTTLPSQMLAASARAMVSSIDLSALTAAPIERKPANGPRLLMAAAPAAEDGIDLTVSGGVPGCAYTLLAAEDLGALGGGGAKAYGPEVCGPDGTVTFRSVKRPSASKGFFTIRYER